MLAPGWGTGTRGGSPPGVKLGSLPVTSIPPTHELSQSHFSCFTLTSQEIHSLSTWFGHGSCIFNGIDMLSSPIFYLYSFDLYLYSCFFAFYIYIYILIPCIRSIFNYVATFYLEEFFCAYSLCSYFFCILSIRWYEQWTSPPQEPGFHPGSEPFTPNVAIPRFPVLAIVWNIFQHLLVFYANK